MRNFTAVLVTALIAIPSFAVYYEIPTWFSILTRMYESAEASYQAYEQGVEPHFVLELDPPLAVDDMNAIQAIKFKGIANGLFKTSDTTVRSLEFGQVKNGKWVPNNKNTLKNGSYQFSHNGTYISFSHNGDQHKYLVSSDRRLRIEGQDKVLSELKRMKLVEEVFLTKPMKQETYYWGMLSEFVQFSESIQIGQLLRFNAVQTRPSGRCILGNVNAEGKWHPIPKHFLGLDGQPIYGECFYKSQGSDVYIHARVNGDLLEGSSIWFNLKDENVTRIGENFYNHKIAAQQFHYNSDTHLVPINTEVEDEPRYICSIIFESYLRPKHIWSMK